MRQKNSAARDEISVLFAAHMAALLHPVKGKGPNCGDAGSNTLLECMEKSQNFGQGDGSRESAETAASNSGRVVESRSLACRRSMLAAG
ncbi:hypothetical protein O7A70_11445 [Mesorhizobium sp. Cs1299R1N1]|uniref:hypothetical protein n=1 Tax=Mesorhizobium sp. Cs1299R1N1 TaxID=3015172 RepID=UPI00301D881B